jgi:hypothetical protein
MAIAKMEKRSATVWNRSSAVSAGIGAFFALVALILLWSAVKNFMVRTSYAEAVFSYDTNRRPGVRTYAERAKSWGKHAESNELLAKTMVEANQLDAAEKLYVQAASSGNRRAVALCGQGIILLRRADAEKDAKKSAELVKKAKDKFNEAKAEDARFIEAQIGALTADLILGVKTKDAAKIAAPRGELGKILKQLQGSEEAAAQVTREGYMDLYVGLARSHASATKFSPEALGYAGSARRYLPSSLNLFAMELALQAQQMVENPPSSAEIRASKLFERLNQLKQRIVTSPKIMEPIVDSWFSLTLAGAATLARDGDAAASKDSKDMLSLVQAAKGQDTLLAAVLEASLAMEVARKPEQNWNKRQANYSQALRQFVTVNGIKDLQEADRAALRATMLNNQAFFEEDIAAQSPSDQRYEQVVALLKRALEAEKQAGLEGGSYEVHRNLAVIQKRRGKPEAADHFKAAQEAAAGRTEDGIRRDLEELIRYFDTK